MTSRRRKKQIVIIKNRKEARVIAEQQQELDRLAQAAQERLEKEASDAVSTLIKTVKKEKKVLPNALKEIPKEVTEVKTEEVKTDEQAG